MTSYYYGIEMCPIVNVTKKGLEILNFGSEKHRIILKKSKNNGWYQHL
ncbi:hypothetical protein [Aquimarina hainanensis]